MMAILPAVIEVEGEEATVEAGHLAAKLGLSVDRLRAEMRRGDRLRRGRAGRRRG